MSPPSRNATRIAHQDEVLALHRQGMRGRQISKALGISHQRVFQILARLGIRVRDEVAARRDKVARMVKAGISTSEGVRQLVARALDGNRT